MGLIKLDYTVNLILLTTIIATSTMAQSPLELQTSPNSKEFGNIFDSSQLENIQALELSNQEMKDTQGAWVWFAPTILSGARVAITGFTRHGLNQAISRNGVGVSNKAMVNTMKNPTKAYSQISNQTTRYVSREATVVVNQNGRVVTTWGTPRTTVTSR